MIDGLWVPESADEVEKAVSVGHLRETASFDAKQQLPVTKRNVELARDVAAMSTAGGVLLYGVGEDEDRALTRLTPIPLAGAAERVAQIVQTSIQEVPYFDTRPLQSAADPSVGYLVLHVPASPLAPHMVNAGNDYRYYGRGPTGNRLPTEREVRDLHAHREHLKRDLQHELDKLSSAHPESLRAIPGLIFCMARPVGSSRDLLEDAERATGTPSELRQALIDGAATWLSREHPPELAGCHYWESRGAGTRRLANYRPQELKPEGIHLDLFESDAVRRAIHLDVHLNGDLDLFCGHGCNTDPREQHLVICEGVIAAILESFLGAAGNFYATAGYHGPVGVAMAVTGLEGAGSLRAARNFGGPPGGYPDDRFSVTTTVPAAELRKPQPVAESLVRRFCSASTGIEAWTPWQDPPQR